MKNISKKLLCCAPLLAALCGLCGGVQAADYTASISTYPVNEAATLAVQLPGGAKVEKFVVSNATSTASAGQVVTVYENCSSTLTVSAVLTLFVPGSAAPVTVDYPAASPLVLRDACFRKSDAGTEVHISVHYR